MGQGGIISFLEENEGWRTTKEISDGISVGRKSVNKSLLRLLKHRLVIRKRRTDVARGYLYSIKLKENGGEIT